MIMKPVKTGQKKAETDIKKVAQGSDNITVTRRIPMDIRGINGINPIDNNSKINKTAPKTEKRDLGNDNVQISSEARRLAEEQKIQSALQNAPDVREDKIAEVKARMESGAYDDPKVLESVAEKLMKVLGL